MSRDRIDINVDTGEGFGRWRLGDDAGIMRYVTSASIACGFHAGDPATMRATIALAVEHGVQIGAHVALPDLLGFGRRRMAVSPEEVRDMCTYQIGALTAFATVAGAPVRHVKPHGALYVMCSADPELATAVAEAVKSIDPSLILLLLGDPGVEAAQAAGVRTVPEAFPDLEYTPEGHLLVERFKQAWDPARVTARAIRIVREGRLDTQDGGTLEIDVPTLCVHGDAPNAVEVVRAVREGLEADGIVVAPL